MNSYTENEFVVHMQRFQMLFSPYSLAPFPTFGLNTPSVEMRSHYTALIHPVDGSGTIQGSVQWGGI